MVRVVPIIHRAPPPPRGMIFDEVEPGKEAISSSTTNSSSAANAASKHQRRTHIASKLGSNGLSSSAPTSSSPTNGVTAQTKQKFSLFDYLQELALTEAEFADKLKEENLQMKIVAGDGNCMFRAVADQVYGDEEMHEQIRACCLDYMAQEADFFSSYVSVDFSSYIADKRKLKVYGDHLELQAMAELYNRPVEIRIPGQKTLRICEVETESEASVVPLRLSYHNNNHYNSIRDPKNTGIGVGLGLPANTKPITENSLVDAAVTESLKSDADKQLLDSVALESAQDHITEEMLIASALKDSEWEHVEEDPIAYAPEFDPYAQDFGNDYSGQEEDDLEAAIRLSLQETSGNSS